MNQDEIITIDLAEEKTIVDEIPNFQEETTEPEAEIGFGEDEEFLGWLDERGNLDWAESANIQMERFWR